MKRTQLFYYALAPLLLIGVIFPPAHATVTTPADRDKFRIQTSLPRKIGDALFSLTTEWRIDDGELFRTTGLTFLNASKINDATPTAVIAKKIVTAFKDGMAELDPNWRGLSISQPADQPEVIISNKSGYALTSVIVRDYSNQTLRFDLTGQSFNQAGAQIAIDLVLAADVEYLEGFSVKKSADTGNGWIEVRLDEQNPVHIQTEGKTTKELEEEIAKQLPASHWSEKPLVPSLVSSDTRNNKPFDGSEVQLINPAVHALTITINDANLGVIGKFKFKDNNHTVKIVEPRLMLGLLALSSLLVAGYFWRTKTKNQNASGGID
jgi:hypothetical protein